MLSNGDRVLVAVSGGADSMLLLRYFISVCDEYNITVAAAHVEHGIRGEESIADADFVKKFCNENNIELYLLSIDALNEAREQKTGVEEYSRKKRYAFFHSIPCDKIATAHTLSDNIETAVFRFLRGSGLKGVCGIPPVRGKIIRPLIEISGKEVRAYCAEKNIPFRTDSTNLSNDYSRNYIRNELIPKFSKINSDFESAAAAFISDANEDMAFIQKTADDAYSTAYRDGKLVIGKLLEFDISVTKRVILKYFDNYNIRPDRVHLNSILNLLHKTGRIQLSENHYAVSDKEFLRYADFTQRENDFSFVSKILKISEFDSKSVDFYCDYDKIIGTVQIRSRIAGDGITPVNRGCRKSLKNLYNEMKIPPEIRNSVPVAADDAGVIGVIGFCTDERVRVDSGTENIFCLLRLPSED